MIPLREAHEFQKARIKEAEGKGWIRLTIKKEVDDIFNKLYAEKEGKRYYVSFLESPGEYYCEIVPFYIGKEKAIPKFRCVEFPLI